MKYTLNGSTVALNKDIITEESLNTMIKELDSSYKSCSKAIESYNLISNIKAMENFGYKATEAVGENIANGAKAVWEKIKEFFKRISLFVNKMITDFIMKMSFPKTKNGDVADTTKTVLSNASKYIYDASIKIIKKISSSDIYDNNDELKRYQKLELTAHSLTKIIREDARTLALISKKINIHVIVEKFLDKVTDCIVHTEQMCKLFHDECENPQFDIPKIDKLYKLTEYWLNQVKSSFEEFNENIKNVAAQKTVNDKRGMISEGAQEALKVVEDILYNNLNTKTTKNRLMEIEEKYGKNIFDSYSFEKKEEPWTPKYLEELKMKIMAGIISKELIIHLAEVNDYLRKKKFFLFR